MYQYQMIEITPALLTRLGHSAGAAASYLQTVVNEQAANGWEFYRMDRFTTVEDAGCGCLGWLIQVLGRSRYTASERYVVTFRMTAPTAPPKVATPPPTWNL